MNKKNNRKGFTIVELVIVIAVIAILAAVLIPTFGNVIDKANNSKLLQTLRNEYTEYTMTVPAEDIETDITIKYGEKYYSIEGGAPKTNTDGTVVKVEEEDSVSDYWDADINAWTTIEDNQTPDPDPE